MADYYSDLGVKRDASADDIKRAYRKLAAKHHPDRNQGDKTAEARFKRIGQANDVLGDPQKRSLYDEFGEDALRAGFDANAARAFRRGASRGRQGGVRFEDIFGGAGGADGAGLGDIFGDMFGGRGGARGRQAPKRGADISSEVSVGFAEAIRGAELQLVFQQGGEPVKVRVPAGAKDGDKVRVKGHGAPGPTGDKGDLLLTIIVKPHPCFEREDLDLYVDLPVSVGEAYHGAKVRVPTPGGDVTLTVPAGARSGQVLRLRERGVARKGKKGDLFVRFLVRLPEERSEAVEKAVNELEALLTEDLRSGIQF